MKVAIYIRVSTEEQAREGYSLAAQERSLREKCSREGWEVYDVYADRGISGKDITHRPAMTTMLDDASRHEFDLILVWALSRFTRSVADLYTTYENLQKSHRFCCHCFPEGNRLVAVLQEKTSHHVYF